MNDARLATVVLPEFIPAKWWQSLLYNQTAMLLKAALVYDRQNLSGRVRVVINVPEEVGQDEERRATLGVALR